MLYILKLLKFEGVSFCLYDFDMPTVSRIVGTKRFEFLCYPFLYVASGHFVLLVLHFIMISLIAIKCHSILRKNPIS